MKSQWVSFMMARVLERTPMSDPGGGNWKLYGRERIIVSTKRTKAKTSDRTHAIEVAARV